MYCQNCGHEVRGKFCSNCGAEVGRTSEKELERKPERTPEPESCKDPITCRMHKALATLGYFVGGFAILCGVLLYAASAYGSGLICFVLSAFLFVYFAIKRNCEYMTLTGREVYVTSGLLLKKELSIPVAKIQGIHTETGILGSVIGYKTIKIDTAGTGKVEVSMQYLENADKFVSEVKRLMTR